jgi:hypothetical protein
VANALGELVARANAEQRYPAEREASAVYDQVRQAVVEIRAAIATATARAGGAGDRGHPQGQRLRPRRAVPVRAGRRGTVDEQRGSSLDGNWRKPCSVDLP